MVFSALTPPSGEAISWPDGIYSILRHGVTLTSCDSEPVQTPGCIQAHGVLLVVRPSDLAILQVSESSTTILGLAPEELLGRPLGVALGGEHEGTVRRFLDQAGPDGNPLYVVTLPARGEVQALDVTVHTVEGIAIIELEATDRATGVEPDYYGLIKKSVVRLQGARSLAELSRILTDEVRALTGFDRVMVYRFHADGHGEVFAESRAEAYAPWLGLHYPAEDIPLPAREVFKQTWCRPVPDVEGALAELVPLARPDTGQPLKMTHCALRGPSIMYTEYLQNMGVSAALTMSLRRNGELWGLIACHHYAGPKPVAYAMRAACEFVAQTASIQLLAAEEREHILYRLRIESVHNELVAAAAQEGGFATIMDGRTGLLEALQAGGAALLRGDRWWKVGATPTDRELGVVCDVQLEWLNRCL